jgi:hypothetical protein
LAEQQRLFGDPRAKNKNLRVCFVGAHTNSTKYLIGMVANFLD